MKKSLLLLFCLIIFFACAQDDVEPTSILSKSDLVGTWELRTPLIQYGFDDDGELVPLGESYLQHTFTAEGRFSIDQDSLFSWHTKGDYEVDGLGGEIKFFSDPNTVELEGTEIVIREGYHFKTWIVQSLEAGKMHVFERNRGINLEGEIIENEIIFGRLFVKVD